MGESEAKTAPPAARPNGAPVRGEDRPRALFEKLDARVVRVLVLSDTDDVIGDFAREALVPALATWDAADAAGTRH